MRGWVAEKIRVARRREGSVVVLLDQDRWIEDQDLADEGKVTEVASWYQLRRAWEHEGRGRELTAGVLFILVRSPDMAEPKDLPFDIEQRAVVVSLRLPVADQFKPLLMSIRG